MNEPKRLLEEFPDHTYEQWHAAAEALLKGASFEKRLVSQTYEGITIQPIYRREDIAGLPHRRDFPGSGSKVRGSQAVGFLKAGWEVAQELKAPSATELNTLVHEGLNGGQSELNIRTGCGQAECCTGGASLTTAKDVMTALDGVALDAVSTYWQSGSSAIPIATLVLAAAQQLGYQPSQLRGGFDNDPMAELALNGSLRQSLAARYDQTASLTRWLADHQSSLQTLTTRGDIYHNAGASATQELGYVMATLVQHIEMMKERGLEPKDVLPRIRVRLSIGSDYFMEIAKIRAARLLWSRIASAYGVTDAPVHIHADTSLWNKTIYDAHTNMLRVTAEAFAAVVAGVDSLHIGTYDEVASSSDAFSRRIARNLHTILREECGLDRVIDPAGGSYYIEWLSDRMAAQSWEVFQKIESTGGMLANLTNGSIQKEVASLRTSKYRNIRTRRDKIVGSNMYPDLKGKKLPQRKIECTARQAAAAANPKDLGIPSTPDAATIAQVIAAAKAGADKASIGFTLTKTSGDPSSLAVEALGQHRASAEYEALRNASAAYQEKTGSAPTILQLNMGPSRKYRMRADWTAAFFEAAGFAVDGRRDFTNEQEAVGALEESSATIAVITSDDDNYLQVVESLAKAVKTAKPSIHLLVAGAPGDNEPAWRAAGVDDFVNVRSNNYELNEQLLKKAGVL